MKKLIQILFFFLLVIQICQAQWVQTSGPDFIVVNDFAFSGKNFFAGTNRGVFLSTDNGITWTEVNIGLKYTDVHALACKGINLFAGTTFGIFISSNNGKTWIESDSGLSSFYVTSFAVTDDGIFAGTQSTGVFLSKNNGISWTPVNSGLWSPTADVADVYNLAISGSNLFAGTDNGVFSSTNNGTSWTHASNGLPGIPYYNNSYLGVSSIVVTPYLAGSTNIFAVTYVGVFLSTDNGSSWGTFNSGISDSIIVNNLAMNSTDTDSTNILAATNNGIYLSTNNGNEWSQIGLTNINISALTMIESGSNGLNLFAGTIGGLFMSSDMGANWNLVCFNGSNPRSNITSLAVTDKIIITANFEGSFPDNHGGGEIFISSSNDIKWRPVYSFHECRVNTFLIIPNNNNGEEIFAGTNLGILNSTDDGMTWTKCNTGLPENTFWIHNFAIIDTFIFDATNNGLFLSTNFGENWNLADTSLRIVILAASGTNLFAGGKGGVYISPDYGTNWNYTGLSNVHSLAVSDSNIFAAAEGGVFLSTNNGISWDSVNSGLTNTYVRNFAVSCKNIFAETSDGIFLSTNNGTNWIHISETGLTNKNISAFAVNTKDIFVGTSTVYFSGPAGQGIWKRPLSEVITSADYYLNQFPQDFNLSQNYPNPFNPTTTIIYSIPNRSFVTIKVFDILGREVETSINEEKTGGIYEMNFDASQLSSGIYFYQIKATPKDRGSGDFIQTKKMILLK